MKTKEVSSKKSLNKKMELPVGTKITMVLEVLEREDECVMLAGVDYFNTETQENLSGVFQVNSFKIDKP